MVGSFSNYSRLYRGDDDVVVAVVGVVVAVGEGIVSV